jgi:hypothetical protein
MDPRLAAAGVTQGNLDEQLALQLKVLDALRQAHAAAARLANARQELQRLPESPARDGQLEELAALEARLVTPGGMAYPPRKLIDQLSNVYRMVGEADQKVGGDAFRRLADLRKDLDEILAATEAAAR